MTKYTSYSRQLPHLTESSLDEINCMYEAIGENQTLSKLISEFMHKSLKEYIDEYIDYFKYDNAFILPEDIKSYSPHDRQLLASTDQTKDMLDALGQSSFSITDIEIEPGPPIKYYTPK